MISDMPGSLAPDRLSQGALLLIGGAGFDLRYLEKSPPPGSASSNKHKPVEPTALTDMNRLTLAVSTKTSRLEDTVVGYQK